MTVFSISRQVGSLGDTVAEQLARSLDAPLLDRSSLFQEIARHGLWLESDTRPLEIAERAPTLLERLGGVRPRYLAILRTVLYDFAVSHDTVVILGLGAQVFFAPVRHALRSLLIAPLSLRVERQTLLMANEAVAGRYVRQQDRERAGYYQYVHHVDWLNPQLYHLMVNMGQMRVESAVELLRCARLPEHEPTPESRQTLDDLALSARLDSQFLTHQQLERYRLVVSVREGQVMVSGLVATQEDRATIEVIVAKTAGVRSFTNEVAVTMPQPERPL